MISIMVIEMVRLVSSNIGTYVIQNYQTNHILSVRTYSKSHRPIIKIKIYDNSMFNFVLGFLGQKQIYLLNSRAMPVLWDY